MASGFCIKNTRILMLVREILILYSEKREKYFYTLFGLSTKYLMPKGFVTTVSLSG